MVEEFEHKFHADSVMQHALSTCSFAAPPIHVQLPRVLRLHVGALVCNESGRFHWARKDAARRGSCPWPPVSPDLMHMDVSFFGCVPCMPYSVCTLRLGDIENILRAFRAEFAHSWGICRLKSGQN